MGKKRKVDTRAGALAKAAEELEAVVKMSPPVQQANNNKRKKESGSVTPRHQYPDSDCESGTIRCLHKYASLEIFCLFFSGRKVNYGRLYCNRKYEQVCGSIQLRPLQLTKNLGHI